ncbi:MAG: hypothetical protein R3244_11130, partial [Thermoanaerobaculia bacterium]|nr:hypothetical protein [Thermoanaerobaculia bacterium]
IADGKIRLSDFGLDITPQTLRDAISTSSWRKSARGRRALANLTIVRGPAIAVRRHTARYEAAVVADVIREQLLEARVSFSFETVMSHHSKIEFMQRANEARYSCYLYYVCTEDPLINAERVKMREQEGGHGVPDEKIGSRYIRSLQLLPQAISLSYRAFIFDNSRKTSDSGVDAGDLLFLEYKQGELRQRHRTRLPGWMLKHAPGI